MRSSRHMLFAVATLATLVTLSGCASMSMSAGECRNASWYQLGWRDGEISWYSSLDQYTAQCAPYGVKPDVAQYEKGRGDGHQDKENRVL